MGLPKVDWSSGIRDRREQTPENLEGAAAKALDMARQWVETAERLLAKAADLRSGE